MKAQSVPHKRNQEGRTWKLSITLFPWRELSLCRDIITTTYGYSSLAPLKILWSNLGWTNSAHSINQKITHIKKMHWHKDKTHARIQWAADTCLPINRAASLKIQGYFWHLILFFHIISFYRIWTELLQIFINSLIHLHDHVQNKPLKRECTEPQWWQFCLAELKWTTCVSQMASKRIHSD